MSRVSCPGCKEAGEMGLHSRGFEPRGTWADGDRPVFRCLNCGCGIVARRRRVVWGARVEQVDPDVWGRMEYQWGRENPLPATDVPATPSAEELIDQLQGSGHPTDFLVHLVAEAAEVSESEVRRMLAPEPGGSGLAYEHDPY